jgi:hypothetical protein
MLAGLASPAKAAEPPPAQRGFQLAIRTGVALPFGSVSPEVPMSDALSPQLPFLLDIGAKPFRYVFVGAYLGVAVGAAAGSIAERCSALAVSCVGVGYRGGLQVQIHILPDKRFDPWFGYGFGYEIGGSRGENETTTVKNNVRGFELGHFLAGLDVRVDDYFAAGPFVDVALGKYDLAESLVNAGGLVNTRGGMLEEKANHIWLILGARAVLFP